MRYVEQRLPPTATQAQRRRAERGTLIRCPDTTGAVAEHYLPIDYVRHGQPVVLGLVGATSSGKTHLLGTMIGETERGGLAELGITCRPLDQAWHQRFMDGTVRPLLDEGRVIESTRERLALFADALLVRQAAGPERVVAFFDVAGVELGRERTGSDGSKPFLDVADGLLFVVDPMRLDQVGLASDDTFGTVLDVLGHSGRLPQVSAAIVLNKADLVRFDDPVTRWLRHGVSGLDPELIARESADVYAYLDGRHARALTRPYLECARATLHVASPTGGKDTDSCGQRVYPRGVTPQRVLAPLIALLAMTGVLTDEQARQIGR